MADSPITSGLSLAPCNVCPRMCGANRLAGERGVCGAADTVVVARAALHFWEEPVLSGERGSGAVFFANCPLRCVYCQNAPIAAGQAGVAVTVERLASICLELQDKGALNVNFVTPTHYSLQIREALACARERGLAIPVVWNTSGYERTETVRALAGTVDVYLDDFKYADAALAARYSHAADYPQVALAALDEMVAQVGAPAFDEVDGELRMTRGVIVRHLLLPGALAQSKEVLETLYTRYGDAVCYSIMNQYTPVIAQSDSASGVAARFPELCERVPAEDYEALLDFADSLGMEDYFWQEGLAAEESFIPAWDLEGVLEK